MSSRHAIRQGGLAAGGTIYVKEPPMVTAPTTLATGLPARRSAFQQTDMISIADLSPVEIHEIFDMARMIKSRPAMFRGALASKQFELMF